MRSFATIKYFDTGTSAVVITCRVQAITLRRNSNERLRESPRRTYKR